MLKSTGGISTRSSVWTPIPGNDSAMTSYTVQGLTNGVEYTFEVRAVNAVGPGAASQVSVTPADVPAAPVAFAASPGDGEGTLSWSIPADNGLALTGYEVRRSTDGGTSWLPD